MFSVTFQLDVKQRGIFLQKFYENYENFTKIENHNLFSHVSQLHGNYEFKIVLKNPILQQIHYATIVNFPLNFIRFINTNIQFLNSYIQ